MPQEAEEYLENSIYLRIASWRRELAMQGSPIECISHTKKDTVTGGVLSEKRFSGGKGIKKG